MSGCYPISSVDFGRCGPKSSIHTSTLEELVERYRKAQKNPDVGCESLDQLLKYYKGRRSLKEAVECAAYAKNSKWKRHSHQYRIPRSPMDKALKILRSEIKGECSFKSFDELHDWFAEECAKIRGLGALYVYDTCLRIGAYFGLMPKLVYLHAGSLIGAKALRLEMKEKRLPVSVFPQALRMLKPHEIEDFLCIFKDQLETFKPVS